MAAWILANKCWDSLGVIDEFGAWRMARRYHTKQWLLVPALPIRNEMTPGLPVAGTPLTQPIIAVADFYGEFEVLDGQHRVSEALDAGLPSLPAYIPAKQARKYFAGPKRQRRYPQ